MNVPIIITYMTYIYTHWLHPLLMPFDSTRFRYNVEMNKTCQWIEVLFRHSKSIFNKFHLMLFRNLTTILMGDTYIVCLLLFNVQATSMVHTYIHTYIHNAYIHTYTRQTRHTDRHSWPRMLNLVIRKLQKERSWLMKTTSWLMENSENCLIWESIGGR